MIRGEEDIERGLEALVTLDPRLRKVVEIAGAVPLRKTTPGLSGLLSTIVGQQVSRASAAAIFGRFATLVDLDDPASILAADENTFRMAGLSRGKQRTVLEIAGAVKEGRLDLGRIGEVPPAEAISALTALHGVGMWTAECYLLFAAGHPDVFPAGDLALQAAVAHAFAMAERPREKALVAFAQPWSPHRSVAARLFWSYYHAVARRDAAPAEEAAGTAPISVEPPKPAGRQASQSRHDRTP